MSYCFAFIFAEKFGLEGYRLGPDCATPDHTDIKEFIRWYIHKTNGRKSENGRPVMSSVLNCAERLFGGFEETVGITIEEEDRSEIFNVRKYILFGKHFEDGTGQLYLSHPAISSNVTGPSNLRKRFDGHGVKIAFTSRTNGQPSSIFAVDGAQALTQNWWYHVKNERNIIGFVETHNKANFYFRTIAESKGFGTNYESVDVCGGMANLVGTYLGPN
ncbi:hypothetical protein N7490_004503 [Penicillium lividum]|nr:hypothetical protein N7490_004503 [Penicillium lividum]